MPGSSSKPKPKPYRQPQLLTLPSVVAHPLEDADRNYFTFTFLPIADLRGHSLFQAFVRFCSASELNAVLVSRAFVSQTYTKQGQMLTVRQVPLMPAVFEIQQKFTCKNCCTFILSVHLLSLVFSTKQPFLLSLRLIGCIANIAPVSGDSMLSSYV